MEFRQLKYFVTVANMKSYTLAAKSLFVTQPTLTWNIQKLEEELNAKLFYQVNHDLQLTETGEIVLERGQEILDQIDDLMNTIQLRSEHQKNSLKVGMTVLFGMQYMKQITQFTSTHLDVELSLIQNGSIELQRKLANREIDIGLLSFPAYEADIEIEPLNTSNSKYTASVVVPNNHPLASKKSIKICDLQSYPICTLSQNYVLGRILYERCFESGFKPNIVFTNSNWEVLLQNTYTTGALTIIPQAFKDVSNFPDLKWIPLKDKASVFQIGIAKRKNENLKEIVVDFIDAIKKN